MIWVFLLTVGACIVGLLARRRARAGVLAGRDAERPTYHVEPPSRRMGRPLKDGAL